MALNPVNSSNLEKLALTELIFFYKIKILVQSNDFDRGEWWLYAYFPTDLVFPQNHCQLASLSLTLF